MFHNFLNREGAKGAKILSSLRAPFAESARESACYTKILL